MGPRRLLLALWLVGALTGTARAVTIDAQSMTMVHGRQVLYEDEARSAIPIIEQITFDATQIGNPLAEDLSLHLQAWGRVDPAADFTLPGVGDAADLDLAYVDARFLDRRANLKLGRHQQFGGAVRAKQIDGASGEVLVWKGLGVSAFGGLPVIPRFAVGNGDALYGGRVFYRVSVDAEVGASYYQLFDRGYTGRQDLGLDGRWAYRSWTFAAFGLMSALDSRLMEADASVQWQPFNTGVLQLNADVRRTAPDLFLLRTSIFSVFAAERRDEVGGGVSWRPLRNLRIWGDYHYLRFDADDVGGPDHGHDAWVRGSWTPIAGSTLGVQGRLMEAPNNGFVEARVYGQQKVGPKIMLAVDLDGYFFADWVRGQPINGYRESYIASASASYFFLPGWQAALTGLANVSPLFEERFEFFAKVVYNFSTRYHEVLP